MVANEDAKAKCPFGTYDIFASSTGALLTKTIVVKQRLLTFHVIPPGGGDSHTLAIRVCAAQRGRGFEAPDLERGIHFRGVF